MEKSKINFDELYIITFDNEYQKLFSRAMSYFKESSKHTLFYRRDILIEDIKSEFELLTSKKSTDSNLHKDEYSEKLLREYTNRIIDYSDNKIANFINDCLNELKKEFKNKEHKVPANIKLNPKQTVEFIAKNYAYEKFIKHLYKIRREDEIDIIVKKISVDGFVESFEAENDIEINTNESNNVLTGRQITIIITYMLKNLEVSKLVDKSAISRFIVALCGKSYHNIYKYTLDPLRDSKNQILLKDTRIARKELEKLGLQNIANQIIKDVDDNNPKY
jgi:hypothetical protein